MAIELKKFQAELTAIDAKVEAAFGNRKIVGDSEGNTKKVLEGAKLAVGDRVEVLRTQGAQGTKLADFAADPEVKKALDLITTSLNNFKSTEERKIAIHTEIKAAYDALTSLAKRIDAEVADRKKKLFEPKSLPDMIKLAAKVRALVDEEGGLKTESIKDIATASAPKAGAMATAFHASLELEINKKAAVRANAAASEATALFVPRLMKLRWDKANSLGKEAEAAAAAALVAQKAGTAQVAKDQVKLAVDKSLEMNGIVEQYSHAYNANKSFLAQNPDHDTIFKVVSGLTSLANRVLKAVQAAQSAVK